MDTRRDFVYVEDLIDLVVQALDGQGRAAPTTSPRAPTTRSRSCSTRPSRRSTSTRHPTSRCATATPTTPSRSCSTRAARVDDFGWKPKTPLEDGVAAAIEYYRERGITETFTHLKLEPDEAASTVSELGGPTLLVVGGAGFVGCNLVRELLARDGAGVLVVDNLLSAERENVPDDPRVTFVEGSIADDAVLAQLEDEFDNVFHLATYHGNQSSIADPLADHENNLITTLKLFERLKGFDRVRKVVYAASGCTLAPHTLRRCRGRRRGRAGAARPGQPVPDLQGRGRVLLRLLPPTARAADGSCALPERLRPGRDPRRRAMARNAGDGVAQRDARRSSTGRSRAAARAGQRGPGLAGLHLRRATSSTACSAARPPASPATSTTLRAAWRPRSGSWPRRSTA